MHSVPNEICLFAVIQPLHELVYVVFAGECSIGSPPSQNSRTRRQSDLEQASNDLETTLDWFDIFFSIIHTIKEIAHVVLTGTYSNNGTPRQKIRTTQQKNFDQDWNASNTPYNTTIGICEVLHPLKKLLRLLLLEHVLLKNEKFF